MAARRVRWSAWARSAVVTAAACGGAAGGGEQGVPPVPGEPRPPVAAIQPRSPVVGTPEVPASASETAPDLEQEPEGPGSEFEPIEWSSLPPPGAYVSAFPFPADGTPEQQRRWLRGEAEAVLLAYCAQCHGERGVFEVRGDFGDVNDFDAIVEQGQLILCDARRSPVLMRMLDRSMPPEGSPVSAADIAVVRDATDFGCGSQSPL